MKGRRPDGKPRFGSVYGRQYGEVKKKLVLIKAELYKDGAVPLLYGDGSLHDWTEYWLEVTVRPYIKESTYEGYRRNIDKHIYPYLKDLPIREITSSQIQNAVDRLQSRLAASTLGGVWRLLRSVFTAAHNEGLLLRNPCQKIKIPKAGRRAPRVLTVPEQARLEQAAAEADEIEYLLCLYTGLRVGELCALRWEDIDFEGRILHVARTVQRIQDTRRLHKTRLSVGTPKSDCSVREIPLPLFLSSLLEEKQKKDGALTGYLFPAKKGCRDPRTMQQRIKKLSKQLGMRGVHMHTLRHTFATRCLEHGIGYEVLSELLGHSSPQITLKFYVHCTPATKRKSMDRLARAVQAA